MVPVVPVVTNPWPWRAVAVVLVLALLAQIKGPRPALLAALAAFFALPAVITNYPQLHTPELAELSAWARTSTPRDAVFLFPDQPRGLAPGIFRGEARRAVYVDWKSGGQVNYIPGFAAQWWFRWQQTLARPFRPADMPRYSGLGIQYVVIQPKNRLAAVPEFSNSEFLVYRVQ